MGELKQSSVWASAFLGYVLGACLVFAFGVIRTDIIIHQNSALVGLYLFVRMLVFIPPTLFLGIALGLALSARAKKQQSRQSDHEKPAA